MIWIQDKTGRFPERPHYELKELDLDCEEYSHRILRERHNGEHVFPIPTDDLTVMIERSDADLDIYADLSAYGPTVEGVTEFVYGKKPFVRISKLLTEDTLLENRLRTTLTHECGHVRFHRFLWDMKGANYNLFPDNRIERQICKREKIVQAGVYDWMEWQAGYCCGALLMPITNVKETMHSFMFRQGTGPFPLAEEAPAADALIGCVATEFGVSRLAARIRLIQVGALGVVPSEQAPLWG